MSITPFIKKERKLKESEDYAFLRTRGIKYIEQLAKKIWTDYNVHDPGITTLEMLCYALTDLAYRTNYPIEDVLAEGVSNGASPVKHFFTVREILTCNPVTLNDYRKILIDVPGVKNAWLTIERKPEPPIYIDCKESRLTFNSAIEGVKEMDLRGLYNVIIELAEDDELGDLNLYCFERTVATNDGSFTICVSLPPWDVYYKRHSKLKEIKFSSLMSIENTQKYRGQLIVEYVTGNHNVHEFTVHSQGKKTPLNKKGIEEELNESISYLYKKCIDKAVAVIDAVFTTLHEQRSLCEDFYQYKGVQIEEILVCADVEVASDADIDEVLAEMYYHIGNFLAPPVKFYSIKELMEKGVTSDAIFEGQILNHGFIDEEELETSAFKEVIHVSDIIQIIMDVKGVVAVKNILLSSRFNCEVLVDGARNCLHITKDQATRLNVDKSKIIFYKGLVPYSSNKKEVEHNLKERKALDRPQMLAKEEYDLPIPKGKHKDIQNYYSIQNDYPRCYGIGMEGLPLSATALRKAQAKQLKGYLLFYDQMLANYFAQLGHVKDLFSADPALKRTYFSHALYAKAKTDLPGIQYLLEDFVGTMDSGIDIYDTATYEPQWQTYVDKLDTETDKMAREEMLEDTSTYEDRRNRFLDHLMARFAEQFTDYVTLMYSIDRTKAPSELIEDKISFLKEYDEISRNRGKAFNYIDKDKLWDTDNISGLEKRVARLLGINNYNRRSLAGNDCITSHFQIEKKEGVDKYLFHFPGKDGKALLSSTKEYDTEEDAKNEMKDIMKYGRKKDRYQIEKNEEGKFSFNLVNKKDEVIARGREFYETEKELNEAIDTIIKYVEQSVLECEGFHLIEHILLRPRAYNDKLFTVCVDKECKSCTGFKDPYSFRVTVIVPYWPERFQNFDFRSHVESTIRMEAPAHVHVKICWVTQEAMKEFEDKYKAWLRELSKPIPVQKDLTDSQNKLIIALESLRSVYPETRLHDCKKGEGDVVLLNKSILGTMKEGKNGDM